MTPEDLLRTKTAIELFYPEPIDAIRSMAWEGNQFAVVARTGDRVLKFTFSPDFKSCRTQLLEAKTDAFDLTRWLQSRDRSSASVARTTDRQDALMLPPIKVQKAIAQALKQKPKLPLKDQGALAIAQLISLGKVPAFEQINQVVGWFATKGNPNDPVFALYGGKEGLKWWRAVQAQALAERMQRDSRFDATRSSCLECVEKHLGSALVLMDEVERGWPEHRLLAIGHLAQAEEESHALFPGVADQIRAWRKQYQSTGEAIPFDAVVGLLQSTGTWRGDGLSLRTDVSATVGKPCGEGWIEKAKACHKLGSKVKDLAEAGATAVIPSLVGKVVGGAIGNLASQHGIDPEMATRLSETAVQAVTATALYARKPENRTPAALATQFLSVAAGAFAGKTMYAEIDALIEGADVYVEKIAQQAGGLGTGTGVSKATNLTLVTAGNALKRIANSTRADGWSSDHDDGHNGGRSDRRDGRQTLQLTKAEQSALFDLTLIALFQSANKTRKADALPLKKRQRRKLDKVFREWKSGELNMGKSAKKVPVSKQGHKQAIAIALSEAGRLQTPGKLGRDRASKKLVRK